MHHGSTEDTETARKKGYWCMEKAMGLNPELLISLNLRPTCAYKGCPSGLLMNFNVGLLPHGIKRVLL